MAIPLGCSTLSSSAWTPAPRFVTSAVGFVASEAPCFVAWPSAPTERRRLSRSRTCAENTHGNDSSTPQGL